MLHVHGAAGWKRLVKIRAALAVLAAALLSSVASAEIGSGDSRDEVLRQLGKPTSIARRGNHEILLYPQGARVELVDGKVADAKGPLPVVAPRIEPATRRAGSTAPLPNDDSPSPPASPAAAVTAVPASTAVSVTTPTARTDNPPTVNAALEKNVEAMDSPWGASPIPAPRPSPANSLPSFLVGLLLRFVVTVLALKLAFKYWEMDAFWTGIVLIAGIDLALHAIFQLLGPATSGLTTLAPVENGVPGLVLIYTVHRFCFNKRLQNAVLTATAVKTVVAVCHVFLGAALLGAMFG